MQTIATIGYEGAAPDSFDAVLMRARVELVVDVRAIAISRRPGFSKSALSERLKYRGMAYIHLRGLGDPKPGREAARAGNTALFRKIFGEHLGTPDAQRDFEILRRLVSERRIALLCFEADALSCHRTIVANRIAKSENMSILHLKVEPGPVVDRGRTRTNNNSREGLAAA